MDYNQAEAYLSGLKKFGIRLRLNHTERLLSLLGNPHEQLKCIHIAGTNGKGSVCTYLNSILIESGFKVGLYTSPHFYRFNERIKVSNRTISDKEIARLVSIIKPAADKVSRELGDLTFFEVTTAIAFLYFAEKNVDFVVLEVGLGGRLDATNVVNPLVSAITTISRDHTELLGSGLGKIALEKAAVIKDNGLVVTAASGIALEVIEKVCRDRKAILCVVGDEVSIEDISSNLKGQSFDIMFFGRRHRISTRLLGKHQTINAAIAFSIIEMLKTFHHIKIKDKSVKQGFLKAHIPCRLEIVQKKPLVLLDGAHNPDGIEKLSGAIDEIDYSRMMLVFGCSHNKEYKTMVSTIAAKADCVIVTETKLAKPLLSSKIASEFSKYLCDVSVEKDVKSAVKEAILHAKEKDIVVVSGSLYVAAEARKLWHSKI